MSHLAAHFVEKPRACSYLADRRARLEYRLMLDVTPAELGELMRRGWRRFGPAYFRPACEGCGECVTTRVPSARFLPSAGQRRAARKARSLRITIGPPVVDDERLELYARWHAERERARAWDPSPMDAEQYAQDLAFPHPAARELAFRDAAGALVGVGLWDDTPNALSAVYCYYDPAWASWSIGTANVVLRLEEARTRGIEHVYLGYRVEGCASLAYKRLFRPSERLVGRPGLDEEPTWTAG